MDNVKDLRIKVISQPHYRSLAGRFQQWITEAARLRNDPVGLIDLQTSLAGQILNIQEQRKQIRRASPSDGATNDSQTATEVAFCNQVISMIRDLGDGMAWRALNYHRAWVQEMSSKSQTGGLEADNLMRELASAATHAKKYGEVVVLADLTHCLRYGDYLAVGSSGISVTEVKTSGTKSARSTRQRRSLHRKIEALNAGRAVGNPQFVAAIVLFPVVARNHLGEVAQLLRMARYSGYEHAQLSESLSVQVVDVEVLVSSKRQLPVLTSSAHESMITLGNYQRVGVWKRALAPYSIFPLDFSDRAALLLGTVFLTSHLSESQFSKAVRRRGLDIAFPSDSAMRNWKAMDPWKRLDSELEMIPIVIRKSDRSLRLPRSLLGRLAYEFLDEECLIDLIELLLEDPHETLVAEFTNENELWD